MPKCKRYVSNGLVYDPGEIPNCSFCDRWSYSDQLWETTLSGIVCCESLECRLKLAKNACVSEIKEEITNA